MTKDFSGIFNILATPFDAEQQLDIASLQKLVAFQMEKGAQGLTILGVLGEAAKLSVEERQQVMQTVMDVVDGAIPVVVGTSHADQDTCIMLSKAAFEAGAAGVMIAPPRMDNPDDETIFSLYQTIGAAVQNPIVVQDFPPVNGVIMSPQLIGCLKSEIPQVACLKLEDPPLMQKIEAILQQAKGLQIFGGLGGMFLLEELRRGASGTMTGFAFTEILVAVYESFNAGDLERAQRIFDHYLPLIRFENQPGINLTIRKYLLYRRGAIANPTPRDPFNSIDDGTQNEIDWLFQRVGISDPTAKLTFDELN